MKYFVILLIILFSFVSCRFWTQGNNIPSKRLDPASILKNIKKESEKLERSNKLRQYSLEKVPPEKINIKPVMPEYDPLEDEIVSFSMVNGDFEQLLYALSQTVGMNIIIDPDISGTNKRKTFTLVFENVTASTILKEILQSFDFFYEIDDNVIRIKSFQEKIFKLNFLDTKIKTSFNVGGDVLGASDTGTTGLAGNFNLSGEGSISDNIYDYIEKMVMQVKSKNGKFSLNRLAGILYVKDTPAGINAISKVINQSKEMLSRQILIEARIIEVTLSDEFKYGIDWEILRSGDTWNIGFGSKLAFPSSGYGSIFSLNGIHKKITIGSAIEALSIFGETKVISNPSIRSKHGQPAIISVGVSFTYKKKITVTETTSGNEDRTDSNVETSNVFDGLILGVIPFIEENGRISLLINPIKSDVDRSSLQLESYGASGSQITLPQVSIKELSTTISLNDGDVIILGGLIDKRDSVEYKELPFFSSMPLIGNLFYNKINTEEIRELVIILSVSIV